MNELNKTRVTVSMDRVLWGDGKKRAHENNISFSSYIGGLVRCDLKKGSSVTSERDLIEPEDSQLDRIELKLADIESMVKYPNMGPPVKDVPNPEMSVEIDGENIPAKDLEFGEDEIIKSAQERLDAERKKRKIKKDKLAKVRPKFFNPQPKGKK